MVSIITISYNSSRYLGPYFASLFKHLKRFEFEVILVDNDSKDDSVAFTKKDFPKVKVVETHQNLGFARGNNEGVTHAKGDYYLFLNPDAEILDNGIKEIEEFMNEHPDAAIVGGRFFNHDKTLQRMFGNFYGITDVARMLFGGEKAELSHHQQDRVQEVDWVSGGFMMVRADVYKKIDGFDKNIFMYIEDMEICYRARKLGYKIYHFPKASAIHMGQGSSNRTFAIVHIYKGLLYFYRKHKSYPEYLVVKFLLLLKGWIVIVIGLITLNKTLVTRYMQALKF